MRATLEKTDAFIERSEATVRSNTNIEEGVVQLPSWRLMFAVKSRPEIVQLIADLERGTPMSDINRRIRRLTKDVADWEQRARRYGVK